MTRAEIEQQLITIVQRETKVPAEKVTPDTPLADAGVDSLDALSILFAIEEHFGISIPDEKSRGLRTFGDIANVVEQLVAARSVDGP